MTLSKTPWTIEVHQGYTSIESKYYTVSSDVNNDDARLIVECVNNCDGLNPKAIPDLITHVKRVISSIPLTGNSRALELDLSDLCLVLTKLESKNDGI